jgi:hypothetical protein
MVFPIGCRLHLKPGIKCESDWLSVEDWRGVGNCVEIDIAVDARRSGELPFCVTLAGGGETAVGQGRVEIARPRPIMLPIQTICGGKASMECPIQESLWEDVKYRTFFEPKRREFWVDRDKGVIRAGSTLFPFRVFFAPRDARPIESLLIVDLGSQEIVVQVCGSTAGFAGANWGRRRHEAVVHGRSSGGGP